MNIKNQLSPNRTWLYDFFVVVFFKKSRTQIRPFIKVKWCVHLILDQSTFYSMSVESVTEPVSLRHSSQQQLSSWLLDLLHLSHPTPDKTLCGAQLRTVQQSNTAMPLARSIRHKALRAGGWSCRRNKLRVWGQKAEEWQGDVSQAVQSACCWTAALTPSWTRGLESAGTEEASRCTGSCSGCLSVRPSTPPPHSGRLISKCHVTLTEECVCCSVRLFWCLWSGILWLHAKKLCWPLWLIAVRRSSLSIPSCQSRGLLLPLLLPPRPQSFPFSSTFTVCFHAAPCRQPALPSSTLGDLEGVKAHFVRVSNQQPLSPSWLELRFDLSIILNFLFLYTFQIPFIHKL